MEGRLRVFQLGSLYVHNERIILYTWCSVTIVLAHAVEFNVRLCRILCFLCRALWYNYVILTNEMHSLN